MNQIENLDRKIKEYQEKHLKPKETELKSPSSGLCIAAELVAGILVGLVIGYYLDYFLHTKILFLLIFVILGLISSIYNIYKKYK
jgi:ATP synthase protein I